MALTTVSLWDSSHHLINVLTAAAPGGFAAFATGYFLTHFLSLNLLIGHDW
jgi:hypothetical protein